MTQIPSVGRTVHFLQQQPDGSSKRRAAIISEVVDEGNPSSACTLSVFPGTGMFTVHDCAFSPDGSELGMWTWPEIVNPVDADPAPAAPAE